MRLAVAEQEVLELGADVERVEAHRVRALQRAAQHVPRIALIGRALGRDDVAEHPSHALLLRAPRQHREGARVGHRDHVGLLDRVEAGDRGAVEAHARLERVVEFLGVDRERLQLTEDVGEPEADEADVALRDERLDVLGGLRLLVPSRAQRSGWARRPLWTAGQNERQCAQPSRSAMSAGHERDRAVGAEDGREHEQEAEHDRPGGDPVGVWAHALRARRTRAPREPALAGEAASLSTSIRRRPGRISRTPR